MGHTPPFPDREDMAGMGRISRWAAASLAVATIAAGVPGWSGTTPAASADPSCRRPQRVAWVGEACATRGGWEVALPDGYKFFTHGPDWVKGHLGYVDVAPRKPACVKNPLREFHTRLIYAYPSDKPSKYSSRVDDIRDMIAEANGLVRKSAASQGRRMDLRVSCVAGEPSIAKLKLPTKLNASSFDVIIQALRTAGYSSTMAKYWVWLEGHPVGAPGGIGTLSVDDSSSPENRNNIGPSYNVTFGIEPHQGGAVVMLHEGSHNFGGVQGQSAPYGTGGPNGRGGGMHCNDGLDVMCYADGGALSRYSSNYCDEPVYDCRNNTYFDPTPKAGSYLATHWNLGSPANRYFSGCEYETGTLTLGTAGQTGEAVAEAGDQEDPLKGVSYATHSLSTACDERRFVVSAIVPPPAEVDRVYGQAVPFFPTDYGCYIATGTFCQGATVYGPSRTPLPDVDVCFYKGSRQLKCFTQSDWEQGTVPAGTTKARVFLKAGANALYALNIV